MREFDPDECDFCEDCDGIEAVPFDMEYDERWICKCDTEDDGWYD